MSEPTHGLSHAALGELAGLLMATESFEELISRVAALSARSVSAALSCGITLAQDGHVITVASADPLALLLDEQQYELDDGPCLQAMRTGLAVHVPSMDDELRWPGYVPRARNQGLRASLSLPLIVDGRSVGAVNFYSRRPEQDFGGEVRTRADLFAAQASTALLLAVRQLRQSQTNQQLETALSSRSVIDQALGILMAQQGCTAEVAFDLLRTHSQHNNRPLREVAADLVRRISGED